jgi:Na+-driven multidrug efflux pump
VVYGLGVAALLAVGARGIGAVFNKDPEVITTVAHYLRIVPVTYALFGALLVVCASFNAMNHPLRSALLVSLRLFGLAVPLALIGSALAGSAGVFAGVAASNVLAGAAAVAAMRRFMGPAEEPSQLMQTHH